MKPVVLLKTMEFSLSDTEWTLSPAKNTGSSKTPGVLIGEKMVMLESVSTEMELVFVES